MKPSMKHPFRKTAICKHESFKNRGFNPDLDFVKKQVDSFLNSGGKITRIDKVEYREVKQSTREVDEWLYDLDFPINGLGHETNT